MGHQRRDHLSLAPDARDPGGILSADYLAIQKALRAWTVSGSGLPQASVYWGQQDSQRVAEPAIEMRLYATHPVGLPWLDVEANFVSLPPISLSGVDPAANTLLATAHGLGTGDGPFRFSSTAVVPAGLDTSLDYWVIAVDANTLQLAASYSATGGADINGTSSGNPRTVVDITSAGTGTLALSGIATTTRAATPIRYVARAIERVAMILECHTSDAVGMAAAMSLLSRVKARQRLPSQQTILADAHIGLTSVERARALHGTRNAVMFEPRASMECIFSLPTEEVEFGQAIERVGLIPNTTTPV